MKYEDIIVSFQDFEPAPAIRNFVGKITEEVLNEAPSIACLKASFKNKNNRILGQFEICSPSGMFTATSVGNNMQAVVRRLAGRMRRQLKSWKSSRFLEDPADPAGQAERRTLGRESQYYGQAEKDSKTTDVVHPHITGEAPELSAPMSVGGHV